MRSSSLCALEKWTSSGLTPWSCDLEGIQQILVMAEKAKTGFHVAIDI